MNHTTQTFARTSRPSGTQYANSIERTRRTDRSGIVIAAVVITPIVCAFIGHALGSFL
ncbi:MAG: hypothetical protein KBG00_10600 [Rhodoferax sp.]|jgi:hypothetical protein|uniref:hypothetical protein n=1 Tax=Rhodoferax sp. TaxID=50421 RepID=UPI001B465BD7|nr:hypothetical protein [Rhodoferax sp.]MBP9149218.1 hypothetical protein [Rhodoferax sp.]MBP9736169.1 hypothetical protein [Rhodoferax sp.]